MAPPLTERLELRLDEDIASRIETWRSRQSDLPSRSEAIRRLVDIALEEPDKKLQFSAGETLIIHMLAEITRGQKIKSEIDIKVLESALYGGHLWGLEWEYPGVFHHHVDNPLVVKEVVDILDMWDFLETSYNGLSQAAKDRIEKTAAPFGKRVKFRGFDGNNETEHMVVARFLIEDLKRFSHFKGRDLNSHMPLTEVYARMLRVFLPMRATLHGGSMTESQMVEVLKAMLHPERRED